MKSLLGLILALSIAAPIAAQEPQGLADALAAFDRGDFSTALGLLRPLAEQGNAKAQVRLCMMYRDGQGVSQNYGEAVEWYRKAAEQGNADGQGQLGFLYFGGHGMPQDFAEAAKWLRKAAEQGLAAAQVRLGAIYHNGLGVPQDHAEAAKWYRRAAEQGYAASQSALGVMYFEGHGVPQDYVEAHKWFNLAAAGLPGEDESRARAAEGRDHVASLMTPAQIAEAQRLAREWRPTGGGG